MLMPRPKQSETSMATPAADTATSLFPLTTPVDMGTAPLLPAAGHTLEALAAETPEGAEAGMACPEVMARLTTRSI